MIAITISISRMVNPPEKDVVEAGRIRRVEAEQLIVLGSYNVFTLTFTKLSRGIFKKMEDGASGAILRPLTPLLTPTTPRSSPPTASRTRPRGGCSDRAVTLPARRGPCRPRCWTRFLITTRRWPRLRFLHRYHRRKRRHWIWMLCWRDVCVAARNAASNKLYFNCT